LGGEVKIKNKKIPSALFPYQFWLKTPNIVKQEGTVAEQNEESDRLYVQCVAFVGRCSSSS
jgi:hypothetical protein